MQDILYTPFTFHVHNGDRVHDTLITRTIFRADQFVLYNNYGFRNIFPFSVRYVIQLYRSSTLYLPHGISLPLFRTSSYLLDYI